CDASTGIAALLLPHRRTSHSQFRIPIELNESSISSISKNSDTAKFLRQVDLIIWDEVPMQHKYCFEVVHRLLVDLRSTTDDILFGGVPVILGGDFAQILPAISFDSSSRSSASSFVSFDSLDRRCKLMLDNTSAFGHQSTACKQWM